MKSCLFSAKNMYGAYGCFGYSILLLIKRRSGHEKLCYYPSHLPLLPTSKPQLTPDQPSRYTAFQYWSRYFNFSSLKIFSSHSENSTLYFILLLNRFCLSLRDQCAGIYIFAIFNMHFVGVFCCWLFSNTQIILQIYES